MTPDKKKPKAETVTEANRAISRKPERSRQEAAAAKLSPATLPAGAAMLTDANPGLDTESETEKAAERATGRDRTDREK